MADRPAPQRFDSFEDFWPHYVREHSKKLTRQLHFVGTTAALACIAAGVLGKRRYFLLAPLMGYGGAWFSHFFVEKNRPATFTHPLWSLWGDLVMWRKMIAGTMDAEVDRAMTHSEPDGSGADEKRSDDPSSRDRQTLN
jgi:hypothetical protein